MCDDVRVSSAMLKTDIYTLFIISREMRLLSVLWPEFHYIIILGTYFGDGVHRSGNNLTMHET